MPAVDVAASGTRIANATMPAVMNGRFKTSRTISGHAKNLSLIYSGGPIRLAPLYDLVCTRAYDRLATHLAMGVGGEFEPTEVRRRHWERLATELGLGARFVVSIVQDMVEQFPEATRVAAADFRNRYGEKPALQLILPKVRKQARRMEQHLK